ncbi:MAG: MFS transporter [Candidatus Liptonbacteria bacterium]|nr:MFS transporter [Candidatus Liptonbacteria bacterium]
MNNKSLKILFVYNGVFVFAGSLFGPLYAVFVGMIDKEILSVSATWSAFLISTFIFTLIISRVGDKIKEKRNLLLGGFLVRALTWFLFIYATNISYLVFLQILLGLGEALGTPAFEAIFAEHLDARRHIEEYADWKMIMNGMTGIGTLIGGLIAAMLGFQWLFISMGTLALISFFGVLLQPKKLF